MRTTLDIRNALGSRAGIRFPELIFSIDLHQRHAWCGSERLDLLSISQFSSTKAVVNESKYPNIVQLGVPADGLDVTLTRRIINFHKSRHIQPRHGRTIITQQQIFYRWCFSDLATARDFIDQFGGDFPDGGEAAGAVADLTV